MAIIVNVEDENRSRHLVNVRIKVGLAAVTAIELPLILLISFLKLNKLINIFVYYIGMLSVGIGGLCAALVIADLYIKRKHLNR